MCNVLKSNIRKQNACLSLETPSQGKFCTNTAECCKTLSLAYFCRSKLFSLGIQQRVTALESVNSEVHERSQSFAECVNRHNSRHTAWDGARAVSLGTCSRELLLRVCSTLTIDTDGFRWIYSLNMKLTVHITLQWNQTWQHFAFQEQRLRYLKQQEQRQQQQASEQEKLLRLRENIENQETRLKKVRALKGQVEQKRLSNGKLSKQCNQKIKQRFLWNTLFLKAHFNFPEIIHSTFMHCFSKAASFCLWF